MSALEATQVHEEIEARPNGPRISPDLEEVILEIAASERALDDLLTRADRLHASNIQHDPRSCLVCFSDR